MGIDFGLAAADQYFKADDARVLRDQQREMFDWQKQKNESELSLLPAATENRRKRLGIESAGLDAAAARQPTVERTLDTKASTADKQATADYSMLSRRLGDAFLKGEIDHQGTIDVALGTVGERLANNDKAGALNFLNEIGKNGHVLPNTNGMVFSDIAPDPGVEGQAPGYKFSTTDGRSFVIPADSIKSAMGKLKTGDYQFLQNNQTGQITAGNKKTGSAHVVVQGDPSLIKLNDTRPEVVKTFEFWKSRGKSDADAEALARSLKDPSPAAVRMHVYTEILKSKINPTEADKQKALIEAEQASHSILAPARGAQASGSPAQGAAPAAAPGKFTDLIRGKTGLSAAPGPTTAAAARQASGQPAMATPGLDQAAPAPAAQTAPAATAAPAAPSPTEQIGLELDAARGELESITAAPPGARAQRSDPKALAAWKSRKSELEQRVKALQDQYQQALPEGSNQPALGYRQQ